MKRLLLATEIFYQDYSDVAGMPSHWCVKLFEINKKQEIISSGPEYHYDDSYELAMAWVKENCAESTIGH